MRQPAAVKFWWMDTAIWNRSWTATSILGMCSQINSSSLMVFKASCRCWNWTSPKLRSGTSRSLVPIRQSLFGGICTEYETWSVWMLVDSLACHQSGGIVIWARQDEDVDDGVQAATTSAPLKWALALRQGIVLIPECFALSRNKIWIRELCGETKRVATSALTSKSNKLELFRSLSKLSSTENGPNVALTAPEWEPRMPTIWSA